MKVGTRFSHAVQDERASLKMPVQYESKTGASAVAELQTKALASSQAQAGKIKEFTGRVMTLNRLIGKVHRVAEITAGVGPAAGLVGGAAIAIPEAEMRRSTQPLKDVAHRAVVASKLFEGVLTDKIAAADRTTQRFLEVTGTFTDSRNRYDRAVRDNDFEGMARYSKEMSSADKELRRLAASLVTQAKPIAELRKDLDHGLVETAITAVLFCVNLKDGAHVIHGAGAAAEHILKDALIERAAGEVVKRATHH
jgi:hypothetical protein